MPDFTFPLRQKPNVSYKTGRRYFGARRQGRQHAGCDLLVPAPTEVLAMAGGTVIRGPYEFYEGTYALEVLHDNGMIVRYGEISSSLPPGVGCGKRVVQGQVIGRVVASNTGSQMLHLEMYRGTSSGSLSGTGAFKRRADVVDPAPYLDNAPLPHDSEATTPRHQPQDSGNWIRQQFPDLAKFIGSKRPSEAVLPSGSNQKDGTRPRQIVPPRIAPATSMLQQIQQAQSLRMRMQEAYRTQQQRHGQEETRRQMQAEARRREEQAEEAANRQRQREEAERRRAQEANLRAQEEARRWQQQAINAATIRRPRIPTFPPKVWEPPLRRHEIIWGQPIMPGEPDVFVPESRTVFWRRW